MRGNWIEATHNGTGGTGTITLADVTGSPNWDDVFTGTRLVDYTINEYTDSARDVLAKTETGIGSLVMSTKVLTRTKKEATWDGTTYDDTSPAAINFGNTAANVRIFCAPMGSNSPLCIPFYAQTSPAEALGLPGLIPNAASTRLISANEECYIPFLWNGRGTIDQIGLGVTTVAAGAAQMKAGIYEVGSDGFPGARIHSWQNAGVDTIDIRVGGVAGISVRSVTAFHLPPGWYYAALIPESNVTVRAGSNIFGFVTPLGTTTNGAGNSYASLTTASYATGLADPAPSMSTFTPRSNPGPALFLLPKNI